MSLLDKTFLLLALLAYGSAAVLAIIDLLAQRRQRPLPVLPFIGAGLLAQTALMGHRWVADSAVPLGGNRAESLLFLVWALVLGQLLIGLRAGALRSLAAFVLPVAVILAGAVLLTVDQPLEGPFDDPWIVGHIAAAMAAYSTLVLASLLGAMYWVQLRQLATKRLTRLLRRLPAIETIEASIDACTRIGFVTLSGSLIVGAVFASNKVAASRWLLDPKVLASLVVWLYFAILLTARWVGLSGRRLASGAIGGGLVVIGCYFATALLGGSHPFR